MILGPAGIYDTIAHIDDLHKKSQSFQINNFDELKRFFESVLKKLEKLIIEDFDNRKRYAPQIRKLALEHFKSVNCKEAENYTKLLFDTFQNDKYIETDEYTTNAIINSIEEAYEYNKKPFKPGKELNESSSAVISYNNLGNIFLYKNDYAEALHYFERAAAGLNNKNLYYLKSSILQNISIIHFHFKNYNESLKHLSESIKLKNALNDTPETAFCTHLMGKIHLENNNYEDAAGNFRKALRILKHSDDKTGLVVCYSLLAKALMKNALQTRKEGERNFNESKKYLLTALRISKCSGSMHDRLHVYKSIAELNEAAGNFEKADKYLKKSQKTEKFILRERFINEIEKYKREAGRKKAKLILDMKNLFDSELSEIERMLKENEKQKNEFFRNVVHDLKNPIGNVKQLAEYLIPGTELTTEDKNDFMQLILESADASLGLITKLLDNSAIEHSGDIPINFESFNINEEINKIIKFYTIQTVNKSLTLKFDNSLEKNTVKTDRETLMRIFDNLISNAIKFSPSDKNIWVKLSGDNMFLKIEIKDEGPGFSEEDKKKLFTQFSKLSARPTAGEHSTGLGLSIVKKLVDSLNGTIECISEKGKGANMVVRVPINN